MQHYFEDKVYEYLKNKTIVIVGFMGSGKTFLATNLSMILSMKYIDTDILIEEREKMSIAEIFKEKGEKYFRIVEKTILQDVVYSISAKENLIIATGGGLPIRVANQKLLKLLNPLVICLNPPFDEIMNRIKGTKRPLVYRRSRKYIFNLWVNRYEVYQKISDINLSEINIIEILESLNKRVLLKIM